MERYVLDAAKKTTEANCILFAEEDKPQHVVDQLYTPVVKAAQNAVACRFSDGSSRLLRPQAGH